MSVPETHLPFDFDLYIHFILVYLSWLSPYLSHLDLFLHRTSCHGYSFGMALAGLYMYMVVLALPACHSRPRRLPGSVLAGWPAYGRNRAGSQRDSASPYSALSRSQSRSLFIFFLLLDRLIETWDHEALILILILI